MNVFISSVIEGMEDFRDAASEGAAVLRHKVIRAEDFGASPASPQEACLHEVRAADVVVLIIGERYGFEQATGVSATHEEYLEAKNRKPILVFVQRDVEREPRQEEFSREVQDWASGQYTATFGTSEELKDKVTDALHTLEISVATGPVDEEELLERASKLLPQHDRWIGGGASLVIAVSGGPRQQVLRPTEIGNPQLARKLMAEAMLGDLAVLDPAAGARPKLEDSVLTVGQDNASIFLTELGDVVVMRPATSADPNRYGDLPVLIEEDLLEKIAGSLSLAAWVMDLVDAPRRLTHVTPVAQIIGGSYLGWRTRAEQQASPNSYSMNTSSNKGAVHLAPSARKRAALSHDVTKLAEDFLTLLRRQYR